MNEFLLIVFLGVTLFLWMSEKRPPVVKKQWLFSDEPNIVFDDGIVLTSKTYKGYVTIPGELVGHPIFTLDAKRFHDLVCLWTLAEHGGVWITPTMHSQHGGVWITPTMHSQHGIKKPLLEYDSNKEFHGYYDVEGIDTRYMECIKGSAFIRAWRDEYSRLAEFPSVERYLQSRSVGSQQFIGDGFMMDPMMVACKMVLPEHIKRIELRKG
jgi:hypothetical protein